MPAKACIILHLNTFKIAWSVCRPWQPQSHRNCFSMHAKKMRSAQGIAGKFQLNISPLPPFWCGHPSPCNPIPAVWCAGFLYFVQNSLWSLSCPECGGNEETCAKITCCLDSSHSIISCTNKNGIHTITIFSFVSGLCVGISAQYSRGAVIYLQFAVPDPCACCLSGLLLH